MCNIFKKFIIITVFACVAVLNACTLQKAQPDSLLKSGNDFVMYYDGETLYTWGDNSKGQLGVGDKIEFSASPMVVDVLLHDDEFIVDMKAGYAHAGVLTSYGRLFMWGDNAYQQVIPNQDTTVYKPVEIENYGSYFIESFDLGGFHSGYVTYDKKIVLFGLNTSGQLGYRTYSTFEHQVVFDYQDYDRVTIKLGSEHSAFVLNDDIFVFGSNFNGQLGLGDTSNQHTPTLLMTLNNEILKSVELGPGVTFISTDQHSYGFGKTVYGVISPQTERDQLTPLILERSELDDDYMTYISFGYGHASYKTSSGDFYNIGSNTLYQLGLSEQQIYLNSVNLSQHITFKNLEIKEVVNGGNYQIVLLKDGSIYATGYSDNGSVGRLSQKLGYERLF